MGSSIFAYFSLLISSLGSNSYQERIIAEKAITKLMNFPPMESFVIEGKKSSDLEIARRCQIIHSRFLTVKFERIYQKILSLYEPLPWYVSYHDSLKSIKWLTWPNDPYSRALKIVKFQRHNDNDYREYRVATNFLIRDLLEHNWTQKQIMDLLDDFVQEEEKWKENERKKKGLKIPLQ